MKNKTEINTPIAGTDITHKQYVEMVNVVGEEKANEMVISQKPKAETVGFANQFADGNLEIKVALNNVKQAMIKDSTDADGWSYLVLNMRPNFNGKGWNVSDQWVETMKTANARKEASPKDNGFRYQPFMRKLEDAPQSDLAS